RWDSRARTARSGIARERRDFLVLVSPPARTERQTLMLGGTGGEALRFPRRSTWSHVRARSSSVLAPVSSATTTYARMEESSAAASTASACASVSALDGLPAPLPAGQSQSRTTFRLTRSRDWARAIARRRIERR